MLFIGHFADMQMVPTTRMNGTTAHYGGSYIFIIFCECVMLLIKAGMKMIMISVMVIL